MSSVSSVACSAPRLDAEPKVGTVTMDVTKAVKEAKAGKVEYRTDRTAIVHMTVGKTSFDDVQLLENYQAVASRSSSCAKPSAAKGKYIRTVTLAFTQGPRHQDRPVAHQGLIETEAGVSRLRASFSVSSTYCCLVLRRKPGIGGTRLNRDQKAQVIEEVAGQIKRVRGRLRRGLPWHFGAAGSGVAHEVA